MESIHMVVVGLVGVEMTEITGTTKGAGGLEAEVLEEGEDEAEALVKGEIGAQLGKAVLIEGQRLSSGIGKGNRENLITRRVIITMIITLTTMALCTMENNVMTIIRSRTSRSKEAMTTDPNGSVWCSMLNAISFILESRRERVSMFWYEK